VVTVPVGGVRDLVDDGETGIVTDGLDPEELAGRVVELLRDPHLRFRLGERARRRAVRFSSTPTCRNHCTAPQSCAGSSTPWVPATRSSPAGSPPYTAGRRAQTRWPTRCASVPPPSSTRARCSACPIRAVRFLSSQQRYRRRCGVDVPSNCSSTATRTFTCSPPDASAYASATRASGTSAVTMSSTRTSPSTRSRIDST